MVVMKYLAMYKALACSPNIQFTSCSICLLGLLAVGLHQELVQAGHPGDAVNAVQKFIRLSSAAANVTLTHVSSCTALLGLEDESSLLASQRKFLVFPWCPHSRSLAGIFIFIKISDPYSIIVIVPGNSYHQIPGYNCRF